MRKKVIQVAKLKSLSPERRIAEFLHEKLCLRNHTDGCGWYYESWDNYQNGYSKKRYFKMATELMSDFSEAQIEKFITSIRNNR